jgi:hypothetical protein
MAKRMSAAELASHAISTEQGEAIRAQLHADRDESFPNGTIRRRTVKGVDSFRAFNLEGRMVGDFDTRKAAVQRVS